MKLFIAPLLLLSLCARSQDTTIVITPFPCDSIVTTTLPQVIYIYGYDTSTIEGANFTAYYQTQHYMDVIGDVTVITPLYDTIPAHDTTFTCNNCATCYDTSYVITPPDETAYNGMLPNYSPGFVPLQQRIDYVKSYSNNAYRSSFDPTFTAWPTTLIKANNLWNLMTYNTSPVQQPTDPFPTPAQLPAALAFFDSTLTAHAGDLPDHIALQNEEPNPNYWSGSPTDYINWLNGATLIAHNHGVSVSNGGLIMNIVYYVRWVYQQEGNTAMVNEINARGHLYAGTGPAAQLVIDWYKVEVPALAASNIDYIDLHWYEPMFNLKNDNPNSDTTTGILPIIINFLQERTGKKIISTEFGTDNGSQALFNQLADEFNDNGVKIRIYYAGDGPVAELHPQYWEDWINAHSP